MTTVRDLVIIYIKHYQEQGTIYHDDLVRFQKILEQILEVHAQEILKKDKFIAQQNEIIIHYQELYLKEGGENNESRNNS